MANDARAGARATSTSVGLLELARAQDTAAWDQLRSLYVPVVFFWCSNLGVGPHDIPDVGCDIFLEVAQGIGTFRPTRSRSFRDWIRTIAHQKSMQFLQDGSHREGRKHGEKTGGGHEQSTQRDALVGSKDTFRAETSLLYARAIELIADDSPDWYKTAFLRTVVGGEPVAHVAADLQKSSGAIYGARFHILRRLREDFAHLLE